MREKNITRANDLGWQAAILNGGPGDTKLYRSQWMDYKYEA